LRESFLEKVQELWVKICLQMGSPIEKEKSLNRILRSVCNFFMFESCFVYEADYQKKYSLRNSYTKRDSTCLPDRFVLDAYISDDELAYLAPAYFTIISNEKEDRQIGRHMLALFEAKSLVLMPVVGADGAIMGIVGMADHTREILMPSAQLDVVAALFVMVANYAGLRMYLDREEIIYSSMENLMDNTGTDIYVNDFYSHEILYVNKTMAEPYGGSDSFRGGICYEALYKDREEECPFCPKDRLMDENGLPKKPYVWEYRRPFDGSWFRVHSAAFRWPDGRLAHSVSSIDITEKKRQDDLIEQLLNYDDLTGLKKRDKFINDAQQQLLECDACGEQIYILFIGLDDFCQIVDTYGHCTGNSLLSAVGRFLNEYGHTCGRACHFSYAGFVVILPDNGEEQVKEIVAHLMGRFNCEWTIDNDESITCRASIGVARSPEDGVSPTDLIDAADMAMREARSTGSGPKYSGKTRGGK
jgi:diguanylate cyclase (GGDEF)-like protein